MSELLAHDKRSRSAISQGGAHKDSQWAYHVPALQDLFESYFFPILGKGIHTAMIVILHRDQRHLFARYPADHLPAGRFIGIEHREVEIHEQASLLRFFAAPAELFFYLGKLCNIHCGVKRPE